MKAVVLYETKQPLRVEEVELDGPRQGEVLVRVAAAGVCHSDYHFMNGDLPITLPCVIGHEGAGIVEEVGAGVSAVAPGDHVVMLFRASCGRCAFCQRGTPALCAMAGQLRNTGRMLDGTSRFHRAGADLHHFLGVSCFAERTVVPEQGVVKIKPEVPLEVAALMGCAVMTGVGAVMNTARVEPGASVLVIGAGGVGLNVVMGAVLVGANQVIVADLLESKLELARSFGATHVINAREEDVVAAVRDVTGGDGADYAFEVIGNPRTMATAYQSVRRGGTAVAVGIPPFGSEMTINAGELVYQEKTLKGSYYGTSRPHADMPRLLDLFLAGRLPIDRLVSRSYPIEKVNEAYDALLAGEVARSVLLPGG
ncbi:MAG TPA: Zn-dependent alcohol dehydrogenase [Candidatus Dormibacteraeota bacterium]